MYMDVINALLNTKDLITANQKLKVIDDFLASYAVNRSAFCKALSEALLERINASRIHDIYTENIPKYYIYQHSNSVPIYLALHGLAAGKVKDTTTNIKNIITDIDETIIEPSGNSVSVEEEEKILSVLSSKFPYWDIVAARESLNIININNSHRLFNSVCGTSEDSKVTAISMYNLNDDTLAPEYVFLHELGHVLQVALTGSHTLVPNEFIEFNKTLANVDVKQRTDEAVEIFADTFAIAVMHDSELSSYNPFPFPDVLNKAFESFFFGLFEKNISIKNQEI